MHKFLGAVVAAATVAGAITLLTETRVAAATPQPAAASTAGAAPVALIPRQCDRGWPYEATCRPASASSIRRVALDRF